MEHRGQVYLGGLAQRPHFVGSCGAAVGTEWDVGRYKDDSELDGRSSCDVEGRAEGGGRRDRVVVVGGGPRKAGLVGRAWNMFGPILVVRDTAI